MSNLDILCDHSNEKLYDVPDEVLTMSNLRMLYFEANYIRCLPEKFFFSLPNLTWLDLRSNLLEDLPANIADHKNLETLLLQNNRLEYLPNEIGLVPTLKMLQVSGNPLLYPTKDVLEHGVQTICAYLKEQYEKILPSRENLEEETIGNEKESYRNIRRCARSSISSKTSEILSDIVKKSTLYGSNIHGSNFHGSIRNESDLNGPNVRGSVTKSGNLSIATLPVISVKSLSKSETVHNRSGGEGEEPEKTHQVLRQCPKFTVKSQFMNGNKAIQTTMKVKSQGGRIDEQVLTDMWMSKLKELLSEQERLIQQEKNLRSLTDWRLKKKQEPERIKSEEQIVVPPFATDSNCQRILSKEDLKKQLDKLPKPKNIVPKSASSIDRLMDDVLSQLKNIEDKMSNNYSPRTKMQNSEEEIKAILELHKRIASLQVVNDGY